MYKRQVRHRWHLEDGGRVDVLDVMSRLVDKSLVTAPAPGETRFTQLQTLWEYGTARLDDSDEADTVRTGHAAYYLSLIHI